MSRFKHKGWYKRRKRARRVTRQKIRAELAYQWLRNRLLYGYPESVLPKGWRGGSLVEHFKARDKLDAHD